jgi:hypothetical protein
VTVPSIEAAYQPSKAGAELVRFRSRGVLHSGRSLTAVNAAGDYRVVAVELLTLLRTVEEPADKTRAEATR